MVQADIAPHWCTCLNWQDAMETDEDKETSTQLANIVVDTINDQLKDVTNLCAKLKLKEILSSKKLVITLSNRREMVTDSCQMKAC